MAQTGATKRRVKKAKSSRTMTLAPDRLGSGIREFDFSFHTKRLDILSLLSFQGSVEFLTAVAVPRFIHFLVVLVLGLMESIPVMNLCLMLYDDLYLTMPTILPSSVLLCMHLSYYLYWDSADITTFTSPHSFPIHPFSFLIVSAVFCVC